MNAGGIVFFHQYTLTWSLTSIGIEMPKIDRIIFFDIRGVLRYECVNHKKYETNINLKTKEISRL